MDWYLPPGDQLGLRHLRREIAAYLTRHAEADAPVDDVQLIVEELVGNAVRHSAGPVWVNLSWAELQPTLVVRDLGPGFDPSRLVKAAEEPLGVLDTASDEVAGSADASDASAELDVMALSEGGRGLLLVTHLADTLDAAAREGGGMLVEAKLPVKRSTAVSHDPPRHVLGVLPDLDEALPTGGFGKESFLRALVVQLAQAIEYQQGPEAAQAAVAQVGVDVGGQMELEFRQAKQIVGRLTPEQLADCYVRLKHAIDGGFYVVEASEDRLVLGNRRCPFGDAVKKAPALCRMTSAVFGGIAARNSVADGSDATAAAEANDFRGAAVILEERIAVGDPGCRVVVHLHRPSREEHAIAHHYQPPR